MVMRHIVSAGRWTWAPCRHGGRTKPRLEIGHGRNGLADDCLLNSYGSERKAVAETNSAQSMENAMRMFELIGFLLGPGRKICKRISMRFVRTANSLDSAAIAAQKPHFDSLRLQVDYSYGEHDDTSLGIDDYRPLFRIGGIVPHHRIAINGTDISLCECLQGRNLPFWSVNVLNSQNARSPN